MRNILLNLLLAVVSITVLAIVLEIGVRLYSELFFPKMMVLDDDLGWRHAKDTEKIFVNADDEPILVKQNIYGHRGATYSLEKSKDKFRVLVLGDSFTEGIQVSEEDLFTTRVEKMNQNLEMLNAGVGGYGTVQQYMYLMTTGLQFQPDAVLLMFFRNDLKDNCSSFSAGFGPRPYAVNQDSNVIIVDDLDVNGFSEFALPVPFLQQINKYSYLYNFVNTRIYQRIYAKEMREKEKLNNARLDECDKNEIFFNLLFRFKRTLASRNIEFYLMLIPTAKQAADSSVEPGAPILDFCSRQGLRCMSLMPALHTAIAAGDRAYFERDIHWTLVGHKIVAKEIHSFLTDAANNP